ncbi:MAG: hypothetical protein GQF41_2111 [Candidatus Rifleibacterium amylolyticum]|nr:MAG: hypothetical protein GQF41_2111 [Candidatus Rifleibacterium amylolyticum]
MYIQADEPADPNRPAILTKKASCRNNKQKSCRQEFFPNRKGIIPPSTNFI